MATCAHDPWEVLVLEKTQGSTVLDEVSLSHPIAIDGQVVIRDFGYRLVSRGGNEQQTNGMAQIQSRMRLDNGVWGRWRNAYRMDWRAARGYMARMHREAASRPLLIAN